MEIDEIIEVLNDTSCDFHCGYGEEIKTVFIVLKDDTELEFSREWYEAPFKRGEE